MFKINSVAFWIKSQRDQDAHYLKFQTDSRYKLANVIRKKGEEKKWKEDKTVILSYDRVVYLKNTR